MTGRLTEIFAQPKPVLGMLHLTGDAAEDRLELALRETALMIEGGVDGVVVENYFGTPDDVRRVLDAFAARRPDTVVGLNLLRDFRLGFDLVRDYGLSFLQIDSVAGHLPPDEDADYAAELADRRASVPALILGGVRFKYQPVKSGRSEDEDLRLGMDRADAIVVTGLGTGQETGDDKVQRFRAVVGDDYPLFIGAGLTADTAARQLAAADGAIVGSYFKDSYKDTGRVDLAHVRHLMNQVRQLREKDPA